MTPPNLQDLFATHGTVDELELDDALWEHLLERGTYAKHEDALSEILQAFAGSPRFSLNASPTGRVPLIMLGPCVNGRLLRVPIEPTGKRGIWRPVTAFEANAHHRRRFNEE